MLLTLLGPARHCVPLGSCFPENFSAPHHVVSRGMGIWKGPFLRPATGCNSEVSCSHFQRLDVAATGPYSDLSHDCPGAAPCWPLTPGLKTDWGAVRGIALPFLAVKVGKWGVWVDLFFEGWAGQKMELQGCILQRQLWVKWVTGRQSLLEFPKFLKCNFWGGFGY